ncbi:Sexual differentiation process protein isp4-like protein 1 [Zalerion maritima]|uniref:Sexual differentiation process protein isp4-like protein 1 n=1 Tax=Zalerion maritima TaxID=339359 RepID=A0AAD5WTH0_9PEZI|nr:Sexual differentiation process protein isp4-like protein 1 [Zalerion maritima]
MPENPRPETHNDSNDTNIVTTMQINIRDTMQLFGRRRKGRESDDDFDLAHDLRNMSPDVDSSAVDALHVLREFEKQHELDPNLPLEELNGVDAVLASGDAEKRVEIQQALIEENSPYPEVMATIRPTDDDELPANTIRAWVIGMFLCTLGSAFNALFSLRYPSVTVTTFVIQLVAYPIGLFWDLIMPDRVWELPRGMKFNLRPGKFNIKEHVVITVMSNAAYGGGWLYATDVLVAQRAFYKERYGWAFELLLGITTLCTGYGLAGIARRFLVWPASMIWPQNLVNATLFYTLHDHSLSDPAKSNGWRIGRYRWFLYLGIGSFVWYWFPGFLFQGLSVFAFVTWIKPQDVTVNTLFGGWNGYGLIPITFDWATITGFIGSPLIPPFHAIANTLGGVFAFFVVLSMILHYSNVWFAQYFPMHSQNAWTNKGSYYFVSRILDENNHFSEERYHQYSPLFLSTQFALAYGLSFAAISAVIVHVSLYHGKDILQRFKLARNQEDDIHMRLMKKYKEAPDWWYAVLFMVMLAISFGVCEGWPTGLTWWAYIVCIGIPVVMVIPVGIIQAVTNIQLGLNVLTEYVVGYMLPGKPLAMMMFKNYGYVAMAQALYFIQDLKLGHYMKVAPRVLFWAQLVASIWSAIVQIAVMNWALGNIPNICDQQLESRWICPSAVVFFTASIVWGAIGPARLFTGNALYSGLQWFWLVGALTPVVTWFFARRYPRSLWRYVNMPLIFGGSGWIPPATTYNYFCWGIVGTIFNYFIKRRKTGWWMHYNYITSAALDCGLFIGMIVIFLTLNLTNVLPPAWFGNEDILQTMDKTNLAIRNDLRGSKTIGPAEWQ